MTTSNSFETLVSRVQKYRYENIVLGHLLSSFKSGDSFKNTVGSGIDTWQDFLAQPEVGLTMREANELIKINEVANWAGLDEAILIPTASLKVLSRSGNTNREHIDDAKVLSTKDLKEKLHDDVSNESGERTYTYMVMKKSNETGNISKLHGVESEEIVRAFADKIENNG